MSESQPTQRKIFTIDEANAMLPLVKAIAADIANTSRDYLERRQRLVSLTGGRDLAAGNPYDEELKDVQRRLDEQGQKVQEYVDELQQLGVEVKSLTEGLVDFPARIDGREVYLCWKLGEPEISYWHDRDAGFAGRQPLMADAMAGGDQKDDDAMTL